MIVFCYSSPSDKSKVNAKTSSTHVRYGRRSGSNNSIDNTLKRKSNNFNSTQDQIRKQKINNGNLFNSSSSFSYEDDENN